MISRPYYWRLLHASFSLIPYALRLYYTKASYIPSMEGRRFLRTFFLLQVLDFQGFLTLLQLTCENNSRLVFAIRYNKGSFKNSNLNHQNNMINSKIPTEMNLVEQLADQMICNGEIGTIKNHIDTIMAVEAARCCQFSAGQVRASFEEAAECFVDSMQANALDTVGENSDYTHEDAERDIQRFEAMRPSVIRRKELESL